MLWLKRIRFCTPASIKGGNTTRRIFFWLLAVALKEEPFEELLGITGGGNGFGSSRDGSSLANNTNNSIYSHSITVEDTNTNKLVQNAAVTLGSYTITTGSDGKAKFESLTAQSYTYTVTAIGYETKTGSIGFSASATETKIALDPEEYKVAISAYTDTTIAVTFTPRK